MTLEVVMEQLIIVGLGFVLFVLFFLVFSLRNRASEPTGPVHGCSGAQNGKPCTKCSPGIGNDVFSAGPTDK